MLTLDRTDLSLELLVQGNRVSVPVNLGARDRGWEVLQPLAHRRRPKGRRVPRRSTTAGRVELVRMHRLESVTR